MKAQDYVKKNDKVDSCDVCDKKFYKYGYDCGSLPTQCNKCMDRCNVCASLICNGCFIRGCYPSDGLDCTDSVLYRDEIYCNMTCFYKFTKIMMNKNIPATAKQPIFFRHCKVDVVENCCRRMIQNLSCSKHLSF